MGKNNFLCEKSNNLVGEGIKYLEIKLFKQKNE